MNELPAVLVINCGSSSIRLSMLDIVDCEVLTTGIANGINSGNAFIVTNGRESAKPAHHSYEDALKAIVAKLRKRNLMDSMALTGYRTVHDGSIFTEPTVITDEVIDNIRRVSSLAPLHNYTSLSRIESAQHLFPGVQQIVILDTSSRQTTAPEAHLYGLPWGYYEELDVRRYDFYGTSYRHVSQRAYELLNLQSGDSGLVVAHLGSGAPVCAVRNGQSVDISTGMAPLKGLMMGVHGSDADFGAMAWTASEANQTPGDLECVANRESGLLDVLDLSSDLRTLGKARHEGHERAQLTIKMFVHHIAHHIVGHAASLHRLDGITFTSRIDESPVLIRCLVIERLAVLGVNIDNEMNSLPNFHGEGIIFNKDARAICVVIPTNEERMIARDVTALGRINTSVEFI